VAVSAFYRQYLRDPVRFRLQSGERSFEGVTAIAQNSEPFTFFADRPIHVCEGVEIDDGTLSIAVLRRAAQRDVPTIVARVFSERLPTSKHSQVDHLDDVTEARVTSISTDESGAPRPFPIQVDGDYIGESSDLTYRIAPGALTVVA
jgi:diacylglycerol kinase family enzyme